MLDESINNTEQDEFLKEWNREFSDEEIARCCADNYRDQGYSQKEIQERTTLVIDYATGEKITLKDCKDKYGEDLAKDLLRDKKGKKELEPEVIQEIVDIHKRSIASEKGYIKAVSQNSKNSTKRSNREKQFIPVPFGLIDDQEFRQFFKGQYLTYAFLRSYIIRKSGPFDRLNLYENYFLKGKLASSCAIDWLADSFDCSPNTIRKHITELENKGCIKVVKERTRQAWNRQKQHIYIFGTHDGNNKNPKFFIDEVFGIPSVPDGQGVQ